MPVIVKPKSEYKYDILSVGEVMIRLDPGDERIQRIGETSCLCRRDLLESSVFSFR